MKKFPNIPQRVEEDYHSIKDNIPLVSMYTTKNVLVRGMLIPDAFLTEDIRVTNEFKEYETATKKLDEEEIENMVEGEEDEKSYASEFGDSVLNDNVEEIKKEKNDE
ncbi:hypothetical protein Tco_0042687, partial [Tanacetum coccineum]